MKSLNQKLLLVGGKGGVGRTTTAASLGVCLARSGRSVLVLDAAGAGGLTSAFNLGDAEVKPGVRISVDVGGAELAVLQLSTEVSLTEYVDRYVSLPVATSRLLDLGPLARVFDYVSRAAPAVKEILTIGKICHEAKNGEWDHVVVDGPATGHMIELLSAPEALAEVVQVGPLIAHTAWMSELLSDPEQTAAVLVTTPTELAVSELFDLHARVKAETQTKVGALVVNRMSQVLSPEAAREAQALVDRKSGLAPAIAVALSQSELVQAQTERIDQLGLPSLYINESSTPVETAADALAALVHGHSP